MIRYLQIILIFIIFSACGQKQIGNKKNAMGEFDDFKKKEKFVEDIVAFYPGLSNPKLKSVLTEKINLVADDFIEVASKNNPTDAMYQDKIKSGLKRFSGLYDKLDTEDRERICSYFEELMNIVELESSGGHLNKFMYGFDINKQ